MKKLIIAGLICLKASFMFASDSIYEQSQKFFTYQESLSYLSSLREDFEKSTGDRNFEDHLLKSVEDKNWKAANYVYTFKLKKQRVPINGKEKEHNLIDYERALEYFSKSVKQNQNVLSAYQGFRIIESLFLYFKKDNKVVKEYLPLFSKVLHENNYCLGSLYYARSFTKEYGGPNDLILAKDVLEQGSKSCLKDGVHIYYIKGLTHEKARLKTLLKINGAL